MKIDKIKCIKDNHYISGQIAVTDIEELFNYGIKLIINNRPDNEEVNQVSSKILREKAEYLGVKFIDIPFASGTLSKQKIIDFSNLIKNSDKKALFYCRSGARSSIIWGLASVLYLGEDIQECMRCIDNSGYDASILPNMVDFFNNN
tara:strand:- start:1352 stop:1792 length:441 start_codon:yes stop_codon:yes gene_type:complete